ncbi:MAG: hypothetical protein HQL21_07400, partial [Candidatus Omnitrophica bacterium]|nr:hypothetical protein [Candidatus Omnitrophota bacterium]
QGPVYEALNTFPLK